MFHVNTYASTTEVSTLQEKFGSID